MGLAAHLSNAKKQARLMERKVGFISDVDYWGREVGGRLTKSRLPSSTAANQWGKSFYRWKLGRYYTQKQVLLHFRCAYDSPRDLAKMQIPERVSQVKG